MLSDTNAAEKHPLLSLNIEFKVRIGVLVWRSLPISPMRLASEIIRRRFLSVDVVAFISHYESF